MSQPTSPMIRVAEQFPQQVYHVLRSLGMDEEIANTASVPLTYTLLCLVTGALIVRLIPWTRRTRTPPEVFLSVPYIGAAILYRKDSARFLARCNAKQNGDPFTLTVFGRKLVALLGAHGHRLLFDSDSNALSAEKLYEALVPSAAENNSSSQFHDTMVLAKRGLSANLSSHVALVEAEATYFINNDPAFDIVGYGRISIASVISEISILSTFRTIAGKEVRSRIVGEYASVYRDLQDAFVPLHWTSVTPPSKRTNRQEAAHARMRQLCSEILHRRRRGAKQQLQEPQPDMLDYFANFRDRHGNSLTDEQVSCLVVDLLVAGQQATATASAWTLLHIAANKVVADALYQEQINRFSDSNGGPRLRSLTYGELTLLPILQAVIRETLRVHPSVPIIARQTIKEIALPSKDESNPACYVVPKDQIVITSLASTQHDSSLWPQPLTWNPSRWVKEEAVGIKTGKQNKSQGNDDAKFALVAPSSPEAFQPFGSGPHRCVGEEFAIMQIGVIVSTFVRHFEMSIPGDVSPTEISGSSMPKAKINYKKRDN